MTETLTVSLSGLAFSLLLYENTKFKFGEEGFLLGEVIETKTTAITDNEEKQENINRIIKINGTLPCPKLRYFYDNIGKLNTDILTEFLGNLSDKVVAWYRYIPLSNFKFTFREKLIHKQLINFFNVSPSYFTCCLLVIECSDNESTYSFSQNFIRYIDKKFTLLPVRIANLSDPNYLYKRPEPASETFNNILKEIKMKHDKSLGLNFINSIQNVLQKHIDNLVIDLNETEEKIFSLENDVKNILDENKEMENENKTINLLQLNNPKIINKLPKGRKNSPSTSESNEYKSKLRNKN